MIRNFIHQSRPWINNIDPAILGLRKRNENINRKIDHCSNLTDNFPKRENIDSHDNSLYHKSLKNKSSYNMNNYNYSIQSIVQDYNQRWNENITIEDYLKHFTRRHRGAC